MNPSFMAYHKAALKASLDIMMGIPHVPKNRQTDGKLFAQKGGPVVPVDDEEKERETRAYLDNLAAEAKARSDESGFS